MSNKEYYLMNLLFVALLFGLFLISFLADNSTNFITCQVLVLTGKECKSCGLTRDFMSFAQLDFNSPINNQSIFVFFWFLIQLLVRITTVIMPTVIGQKLKWFDLIITTCSAIFVFLPFWL